MAREVTGRYGEFAWFYDRYWAPAAVAWEEAVLERTVFRDVPPGSAILDVACGPGHLVRALAERGYAVTGVDAEPLMIELARQKNVPASFHVLDARELDFDRLFHAAVSMYDSLNHILTLEDLGAVFAGVARSLVDSGIFVFDLNTQAAIEAWSPVAKAEDDAAFIVEPLFDAERRRGRFQFTGFRADAGSWHRTRVTLEQTWFADRDVVRLLELAGFEDVSVADREELLGGAPVGKKLVFVARKG